MKKIRVLKKALQLAKENGYKTKAKLIESRIRKLTKGKSCTTTSSR